MSKQRAKAIFWVGLVLLLAAFVGAGFRSSSVTAQSAATALTIITGVAVVIERLLEAFWSLIDATRGQPWPLDVVGKAISDSVGKIDASVGESVAKLKAVVDGVQQNLPQGADVKKQLDDAKAAYDTDIASLAEFASLSQQHQLELRVDAFDRRVNAVIAQHPALGEALGRDFDVGRDLLGVTDRLLKTFGDNPGRRMVSLYAGAVLGIGVAALLGLDVFAAAAGGSGESGDWLQQLHLAVPATGLIIGLGSNPTHDVIKALQSLKQRAAAQAQGT